MGSLIYPMRQASRNKLTLLPFTLFTYLLCALLANQGVCSHTSYPVAYSYCSTAVSPPTWLPSKYANNGWSRCLQSRFRVMLRAFLLELSRFDSGMLIDRTVITSILTASEVGSLLQGVLLVVFGALQRPRASQSTACVPFSDWHSHL